MSGALDNRDEIIRQIDETNDMVWRLRGNPQNDYNPIELTEDVLAKSRELNYAYGIGRSMINRSLGAFIVEHNAEKAIGCLDEAQEIFKELDEKKWISNAQLTQAIIFASTGKPELALYNALKGIEYYESHPDEEVIDVTMAYYVTGTALKDLKKFDEAEKYYLTGIRAGTKTIWQGRIYASLSNIYSERSDYQKALELGLLSLEILQSENNSAGISRALTDIGNIYKKLKDIDKALSYLFDGLNIRREKKLRPFELGSLLDIAQVYIETGNRKEAIRYLLEAEQLALEINHQPRLSIALHLLAGLFKQENDLQKAVAYFEKCVKLTAELGQKERETKINTLQNDLLKEKEQEIERLRNVELKNAYHLISEKNKEITDSIHYAKRIQKALLASDELLNRHLPSHFVLYKPKDIVSGDFYWGITTRGVSDPGSFYLAVCDSTGHGVPGAFMSLLNITFLNEAINEKNIVQPDKILNYVRERLIDAVSQDGGKDGMDGILMCMEPLPEGKFRIDYSAANNPPVLISKGQLSSLPYDKMPVGKGEKNNPFTIQSITLEKGDRIYLFTDGYADQFGGPRGKKFKHKQLVELLNQSSALPIQTQKQTLEKSLEQWQGNLEQVDDVLIVGIQL